MRFSLSVILLLIFVAARAQQEARHYFLAKTTGPLSFLEYGLGDDRLGGAKMGFLDSNIVLKVVDSAGGQYKVQLSRYHAAYIDKSSVEALPGAKQPSYYLTGSWKVFGDSAYDYVAVNLDEKLPYMSLQQINPSRVVVDIFGATSNTNWITQLRTVKEIKNAYYEQREEDVFRVIIDLKHTQHWGHSIYYDSTGKRLVVKIRRQPAVPDIKKLRIAIDAGHGGDNTGATGTTGILEKDYTLKFSIALEQTLKKAGVKNILMTRTRDTTLSMGERIDMLRKFNPDFLISLHLNSAGSDTVRGTSTYYRYIGFRPLSVTILNHLLELRLKEFGNIGSFNFSLNGPTDYPNCLVEVAFLSNRDDEKKIINPKFQKAVAQRIYLGITDWLKSLK